MRDLWSQHTDDRRVFDLYRGWRSKCFHLMWVSKCFSQHLLNISHDGHLLMCSQGVFYLLGCGGTLRKWVKKVSDDE